ncbi:hypothetical protein N657DRAFT_684466 [Parathielavia appendiculata]|uniref:Uncharacterized protein n=1 Tax=Parathielavia appendiculata TaxID=2587402 RepID=A0AAN6YZF9_9PEZI|nr:hypothetical protein N657DRAFT_684466 [Parathielavia appendiculata]
MAPGMARETAAGGAKDPARAGPAPPPGGSQPIRLADEDDEMDGDETDDDEDGGEFGNGPNPMYDESDDTLAAMIMQFASTEKQAIAYPVADAFITRLQQLRQKVEKEREKNHNNRVDPAALRKIVSEAVAKVVEEKGGEGCGGSPQGGPGSAKGGPRERRGSGGSGSDNGSGAVLSRRRCGRRSRE